MTVQSAHFQNSIRLLHKLPHSDRRRFSRNRETAPAHPEFRSNAECSKACLRQCRRFGRHPTTDISVTPLYCLCLGPCRYCLMEWLMECSMESSIECLMECSMERSIECLMECSIECLMECSMKCSIECSMECSMNCSMECSMEGHCNVR